MIVKKTKLVVLRGPSGSGKSSVAKAVQADQMAKNKPMAYVEQDYFRRIVLKEKDILKGFNIQLIKETVVFLLRNKYDVIMEGIFDSGRYEEMFKEIISMHPSDNFFFYFDISLEETLGRHNTKHNKNDFGENELRSWYKKADFLKCIKEEIIPESNSMSESIKSVQVLADLLFIK